MRCPYCIVTLLRLIIYQVVIAVLCVLADIVDNEPQTTENIIYTYRYITYYYRFIPKIRCISANVLSISWSRAALFLK